jgi:hypothetical protein
VVAFVDYLILSDSKPIVAHAAHTPEHGGAILLSKNREERPNSV